MDRQAKRRWLIRELLKTEPDDLTEECHFAGWLRTRRDSKAGFSFLEVYDGSSFSSIQVIADSGLPNYASEVRQLRTGACLSVSGILKQSQGKGQAVEVHARSIEVLGDSPEDYPIQKKRHSFEHLRTMQHLRMRTNSIGAVLRLRSQISFAIHKFFQERSFHYIHTPIITASDCEGAGHLFCVTTLLSDERTNEKEKLPSTDAPDPGRSHRDDFFGVPTYLTVSGQLEGEAAALALGRIYTFGPTFRAENSNTSRHLSEFWMVEPEMAFARLDENAALAEDFLKYISRYVLEHCEEDMAFFEKRIDSEAIRRQESLLKKPFTRLSYTEVIQILKKADQKFSFPVEWGLDLQSEHERYLSEKHVGGPVVVTDYPKAIKSFYMRLNEDGKTVRAMDVLVPGVGEIIGGSEREERYEVLQKRMEEHGLGTKEYEWYLDLRRFGSAPHSGFGLGLERLVQYISGMENIRDVTAFPRTPKHARIHSGISPERL